MLDSFNPVTGRAGSNQVGRYTDHHHHAQGFGASSVGNVLRGSGTVVGKWGLALHGTHDALVERNIGIDFFGAAFVVEDGYEVRNVFRRNFAAYNIGDAGPTSAATHMRTNNPGIEGAGFWLHGIRQTIENNESWNNSTGMNLFNLLMVAGDFPSVPGGALDTPQDRKLTIPLSMRGNVTASNTFAGLEYWDVPKFPNIDHVASYNDNGQIIIPVSDTALYFVNPTILAPGGVTGGITSPEPYIGSLDVEGGRILGCRVGLSGGGAQEVRFVNVTLQNALNLDFEVLPHTLDLTDVLHVPLDGFPKRFILFGSDTVWDGTGPPPLVQHDSWQIQRGSLWIVRNWQRHAGENYQLFERQQLDSLPSWSSDVSPYQYVCPEPGLTMGACWSRYGIAFNGEAVAARDAVPLDGLERGIARPGLVSRLGPPRFVATYPLARHVAKVELDNTGTFVWFYGLMTGDRRGVSEEIRVSVDGGPTLLVPASETPALRHAAISGARRDGRPA